MGQNQLSFFAKAFGTRAAPASANIGVGQLDPTNALFGVDRHARDYTAAYSGNVGMAANQAGATLSAALATTYVGFCLSNPAASGKNLALIRISGMTTVAPAAILGLGLIAGYAAGGIVTHTTPITPVNALVGAGGNALVGLADAACTLVGTPAWALPLGSDAATTNNVGFSLDVNGAIIIPPGGYVAIGATVAGPAAGFWGGAIWEEVAP